VTGLTPEFGYLLDRNRRGRLPAKKIDASALGYLVGQKAVNRVPVIEHRDFSNIELKNMEGAMAAAIGSACTGMMLLQAAYDGHGSAALVVNDADSLMVSGVILAGVRFGKGVPVVECKGGGRVEADGHTGQAVISR